MCHTSMPSTSFNYNAWKSNEQFNFSECQSEQRNNRQTGEQTNKRVQSQRRRTPSETSFRYVMLHKALEGRGVNDVSGIGLKDKEDRSVIPRPRRRWGYPT